MNPKRFEDIYPLSPLQSGMLFHSLQDPGSGAYVMQFRFLADGLDAELFHRSWQWAVERHPALRTSILGIGSTEPVQAVHRRARLSISEHDGRGWGLEHREAWVQDYLARDSRRGFDLGHPPLMRMALLRAGDDSFDLIWSFHHILLDGWSVAILLADVMHAYEFFGRNDVPQRQPPPRYRDYIAWLHRQDLRSAERYWRETLTGFTSPTSLRIGKAEPVKCEPAHRYDQRFFRLADSTTRRLRSVAAGLQVTLNTLFLGAWSILQGRYSGDDDIVFGTTVSGRPPDLPGVESTVGLFINTIPTRVRLSSEDLLDSWLRRLQDQQLVQQRYEHSPLWRVQQWSDVPPGSALFESLYLFQNYPVPRLSSSMACPAIRPVAPSSSPVERTGYPLMLTVLPRASVSFRLTYDRDSFDADTIERMGAHLQRLLECLADGTRERLLDLPLSSEEERDRVLVEWNDTGVDRPAERCIHEIFEEQVDRTPEAVAVVFADERDAAGDIRLTYGELNRRSNQLAQRLRDQGVKPGTLVGLSVERGPGMVVGILGILKAGGAYVPLDAANPPERLAFIVEDTSVVALVTESAMRDRLPQYRGEIVVLDGNSGSLDAYIDSKPDDLARPADLAYVIYTSGSTGKPKGVEITHRNVVNFLESMRRAPGFAATDVLLAVTTLSFDIAVLELLLPLVAGGTVVIGTPEAVSDGERLQKLLDRHAVTVMQATPVTWRLLLQSGWEGKPGLKMLCGGEALPRPLAGALLRCGAELWNMYGPTETTVWSSVLRVEPQDEVGTGPTPIGRPIANTRCYILDRHARPVPQGVVGELYIGGDGVGRGYLKRPELSEERFLADPFRDAPGERMYRTGDLASYDMRGRLLFHGRSDHQVKIRGIRIELGEIECVLAEHDGVSECAAVVHEPTPGDQRIVAYVAPEAEGVDRWEMRRFLCGRLPDYMVPSSFVLVDSLPRTSSGKIDRSSLPPADRAESDWPEEYAAPETETEALFANLWSEILGIQRVGAYDMFFNLGGHSLNALQFAARVKKRTGIDIEMRHFVYQTLRQLAAGHDARTATIDAPRPSGRIRQVISSLRGRLAAN